MSQILNKIKVEILHVDFVQKRCELESAGKIYYYKDLAPIVGVEKIRLCGVILGATKPTVEELNKIAVWIGTKPEKYII